MRGIFMTVVTALALATAPADAQFRRGILSETAEVTLFPAQPPSMLLPPGSIHVEVKNASNAPARLLDRVEDALGRQMAENDGRLRLVGKAADFQIVATVTEWTQTYRTGSRWVSETRQVGTREVTDAKGNKRTEPIYEYGHNKPTSINQGSAAIRVEVRRGGNAVTDQTATFTYFDERLSEGGPPSAATVESAIVDGAVRKAAGLVTPGREPVRVFLARSDEVDKLNELARSRKWTEWRAALQEARPHKDPRRDAYRLHNLAVACEALAYEAAEPEARGRWLTEATTFVQQAVAARKDERYFTDASARISKNSLGYTRLRNMLAAIDLTNPAPATAPASGKPAAETSATPAQPAPAKPSAPASSPSAAPLTNQDVIDLRKAGLDDDNLVAAIREAKQVKFDLSPAALKALLAEKVSNRVITAMREKAR